MPIHARPDARPGFEYCGSLGNLWLDASTKAEVRKLAAQDLEIRVEDLLHNRRRDDERVKAVMRPLIDFIVKEYEQERLYLDIPLRHMHQGRCTYIGAAIYGFDGGERMPEMREVLSLHMQVGTPDPDGAEEGMHRTVRITVEVPKDLANEFTPEGAEAWKRGYNATVARKRLKEIEESSAALRKDQEAWNAVERRNS